MLVIVWDDNRQNFLSLFWRLYTEFCSLLLQCREPDKSVLPCRILLFVHCPRYMQGKSVNVVKVNSLPLCAMIQFRIARVTVYLPPDQGTFEIAYFTSCNACRKFGARPKPEWSVALRFFGSNCFSCVFIPKWSTIFRFKLLFRMILQRGEVEEVLRNRLRTRQHVSRRSLLRQSVSPKFPLSNGKLFNLFSHCDIVNYFRLK